MAERLNLSIKTTYTPLIDKILEHRPHLKSTAGVVERALDFYLDDIMRVDGKIKGGKKK